MSGKALLRAFATVALLGSLTGSRTLAADGEAVVRIGDWTMTGPQITAEFGFSSPSLVTQVRRDDNAARLLAVDWYSNALIAKAAADDKLFDKLPGLSDAADALRRKMIAGRILPWYMQDKFAPDEQELKQFMQLNEQLCRAPARYRVARIGVVFGKRASEPEVEGAKARIADVEKRIKAGESFATLADEKSDLAVKAPGGEIGWLTADEIGRTGGDEKLTTLRKGQVSPVTQTSDGFVIWKMLDREEPRTRSFEECRATLESVMNEKYRAQIARDWVEELAKRYDASLNMDAFVAAVRAVEIDPNWLQQEAAKEAGEPVVP